ncbi:hypothetical protein [Paenochrobactrum glaciei]|uniref:Uncharacterized protein n=1 Tax=Paenochrobactrum glaciei TaxID=486407 RepID=A0ABN1FNA2_9HYPH
MSDLIKKWSKERRNNQFPNVGRIAHFSPQAQLITLDAYTKDDLAKAMVAQDHEKAAEIYATIAHEITHWADVVGTVWGQGYVKRIYSGYRTLDRRNEPGSEADFPQLIKLYDEGRRLSFPDYYRIVVDNQPPYDPNHPWVIQFSAGLELDTDGQLNQSRPILFVRFLDHFSQRLLLRQPITIAALLETIAMASEYHALYSYIDGKVPEDQKIVTKYNTRTKLLQRLYEPELSLYSAPAHLLAHFCKIRDAIIAYKYASRISHLCLNLTDVHFNGLQLSQPLDDWGELFPAFKAQRDRGFAFAVICSNLAPFSSELDADGWINNALSKSGLPSAEAIMEDAIDVISNNITQSNIFAFDQTETYMLELGFGAAKSRIKSPLFGLVQSLNTLGVVPPIVDCEGEIVDWPSNKFDFQLFDAEGMVNFDFSLEGYIKNILKGCR